MTRSDLVSKRLAYIARQKTLHAEAVNVDLRGRAPDGTGPANRDGMPKLPVGQHEVTNWPVLDLGTMPDISPADWRLEIAGDVHNPMTLKGTKWVRRIEFLPRDRRGFWEVRGYSNTAEPWLNDRYS